MSEQLEERINTLELQLAFQDDTIESLNQALTQQQLQLTHQQELLRLLTEKLQTVPSHQLASEKEEMPPPHY